METAVITNKNELLSYKEHILTLFYDVFGCRMPSDLWDWAYVNNPFGDPCVALAFDNGLVGHYAVIPYPLSGGIGYQYCSYLSMTTMVSFSHRKHNLFAMLANEVYSEIKKTDADWVMGFPNKKSAPGFRKRLNWEVLSADYIVTVDFDSLSEMIESEKRYGINEKHRLFADFNNERFREWRLSKPGVEYNWGEGLVYKLHEGAIDVIGYNKLEDLHKLPSALLYNILVPPNFVTGKEISSVEYMFGGLSLNKTFSPGDVSRQMGLSDVF